MTIVTTSPLPEWVLDTFEGKFLQAWLGSAESDGMVVFEGDTENEDEEDIILLEMNDAEVAKLAALAEMAGTEVCNKIARLLKDPKGTEIVNEFYGKIDISAVRYEAGLTDSEGGLLMVDPDHLLHSLASRFPEEIPFVETTWGAGGTFITAAGIEWFKKRKDLEARKSEFAAAGAAPKA